MKRGGQVITDKELQVRIFNNFMRSTFITGANFRFVNGVAANEPSRYLLGQASTFSRTIFILQNTRLLIQSLKFIFRKLAIPAELDYKQ